MASGSPQFQTTLWSQVLLAAREPDSTDGRRAIAQLCEIYWYPVYAFIRRRGVPPADAQDLTQGFFAHVLSSGFFTRADPELGRFRNFLLGAVRNFLSGERDKQTTQRRGGLMEKIPFDASLAEHWLSAEPSPLNDPTRAFDRAWASALLHHAMIALEQEQAVSGKATSFQALKEFLQRPANPGEYDAVAARLGMAKGAVAVAVHRLNERFGELVRKSVRETVTKPEMAEEEMRFLFSALHN